MPILVSFFNWLSCYNVYTITTRVNSNEDRLKVARLNRPTEDSRYIKTNRQNNIVRAENNGRNLLPS